MCLVVMGAYSVYAVAEFQEMKGAWQRVLAHETAQEEIILADARKHQWPEGIQNSLLRLAELEKEAEALQSDEPQGLAQAIRRRNREENVSRYNPDAQPLYPEETMAVNS